MAYMSKEGYEALVAELHRLEAVESQIEPLFVGMREYKHSKRELTNAVLYLVDSGCKWRQLPPTTSRRISQSTAFIDEHA